MNNALIVVLSIVGIVVLLQLSIRIRGVLKKGKPAPRLNGKLGQQITRGDKLIAYFYSPTCGACKTQDSYLQQIREKFDNIHRLNSVKERDVAQSFGVMGTPTTVVIENGKIKDYFVGVVSPSKILKSLNLT